MAIHKLTDLKIEVRIKEMADRAFSPDAKNPLLDDVECLYLSISKTGTASWLFRYMNGGKANSKGLGAYPAASLAKAC